MAFGVGRRLLYIGSEETLQYSLKCVTVDDHHTERGGRDVSPLRSLSPEWIVQTLDCQRHSVPTVPPNAVQFP